MPGRRINKDPNRITWHDNFSLNIAESVTIADPKAVAAAYERAPGGRVIPEGAGTTTPVRTSNVGRQEHPPPRGRRFTFVAMVPIPTRSRKATNRAAAPRSSWTQGNALWIRRSRDNHGSASPMRTLTCRPGSRPLERLNPRASAMRSSGKDRPRRERASTSSDPRARNCHQTGTRRSTTRSRAASPGRSHATSAQRRKSKSSGCCTLPGTHRNGASTPVKLPL